MTTMSTPGLRAALRDRPAATGALLTIPDAAVATILGTSGCDLVVIDAEHSPFTLPALRECLLALSATPAFAVVRVASADPATIRQVLDLGPDGIQVPLVSTVDDARLAVAACRYPPEGLRGTGIGRASDYGRDRSYYRDANDRIAVIVMIETAEGVRNAAGIAAVDGLDGIFVGPMDLAADLGLMDHPDDPVVRAAVAEVVLAGAAANVKTGSHCRPGDAAAQWASGMTLFLCVIDVVELARVTASAFAGVAAAGVPSAVPAPTDEGVLR